MSKTIARFGLYSILFLSLLAGSPASAQTPNSVSAQEQARKVQANQHYKRANRLNRRGMFLQALKLYRQAAALYPSYKIDLNIGGALDALARYPEAAEFFAQFLVNSRDAPDPVIAEARKRLTEIKTKICSIRIKGLVANATIQVDRITRGVTPMDLPIYLEPGTHRVVIAKKGFSTYTTHVVLKAGQHSPITLPLSSNLKEKKHKPPPPKVVKCPTCPPPPKVEPKPCPACVAAAPAITVSRKRTIGAWVALGIGSALAITGGVLFGLGVTDGNEAHEQYSAATDPQQISSHWADVKAAEKKYIAGEVLIGAAVASLAVSVYLFATRNRTAERPGKPVATVGLAPGHGGGMLSISADF